MERAEYARQYHARPEQVAKRVSRTFRWRDDNPILYLLQIARERARRKGLEFTITPADLGKPDVCPLLGLTLIYSGRGRKPNAASLDRVDSSKGYVPGNVWIVSKRANMIKNQASLADLERIVQGLKSRIAESHA